MTPHPWTLKVRRFFYLPACLLTLAAGANIQATDWVRAGVNTNQPVWGVRRGLMWALPPGGFGGRGGPRGLVRLGYPVLTNGGYDLVNFIAIEPVVKGRRGLSELERSQADAKQGKRLRLVADPGPGPAPAQQVLSPGKLSSPAKGIEQLDVSVEVEEFENGARVGLTISQRSDTPDEMRFTIHTRSGSTSLEYCILTATMGNMARTRLLWLKDEVVSSLKLYHEYKGNDFAPHTVYPLDRLSRTANRDVLAALTTNEEDPVSVWPFAGRRLWHYAGRKVTQYWKKPGGTAGEDLRVAVNGRYTYWQTQRPIPGGIAFENFELRERFYEGQSFIFGITSKTPADLGMSPPRN